MSTIKMKKKKKDNFTTNNRKFILFGMFPSYFFLIWMMAVSNFEFKEVLYMFLFVSKLLGLQVNDMTSVRGRYWIVYDIKE